MLAQVRIRLRAPGSTNTQVTRRHTSPRQIRAGASAAHPVRPPLTAAAIDATSVIQIQVETSLLDPRRGSMAASIARGASGRGSPAVPARSRARVGEPLAEPAGDAGEPLRRPGLVGREVVDLGDN